MNFWIVSTLIFVSDGLFFQFELKEARKEREAERKESAGPQTTKCNIPQMYNDCLPFDNFQLLKEWDASMYCGEVLPRPTPGQDPAEEDRMKKKQEKFIRYVSHFTFVSADALYFPI